MISNLALLERCKQYIQTDPSKSDHDELIKDALITSNREIANLRSEPLAWNTEVYDEIFTRYYATISAITAAATGVITAASVDPDTTIGGTMTGDDGTVMTDLAGRTLSTIGIEVDQTVSNVTDGSTGTITDVTDATLTVTLAGGTDNSWDDGDTWRVTGVADHKFQTGDIVFIQGVNGADSLHRLNERLFRVTRIGATTLSLLSLNGEAAINTTGYPVYSSGGTIYHAGIVLPASTIEPAEATKLDVNYEWGIKRIYDVQFDRYPSNPITEAAAQKVAQPGGRPERWRYQQYAYGTFASEEHLLFWYNFPSQRYNVTVSIEKEYPDLSDWSDSVYPPCPGQIHEYIWHRALSNLAMHSEKQRRATGGGGDNTKMEIVNANYWMSKTIEEEALIFEYHRKLSGGKPYMSQSMSA